MTTEDFVQRMSLLGYSREAALDTVWIASNPRDLTGREFNIVPVDDDQYEILKPSDRAGYFPAMTDDGGDFKGSLDEAFEYILEVSKRRKLRLGA